MDRNGFNLSRNHVYCSFLFCSLPDRIQIDLWHAEIVPLFKWADWEIGSSQLSLSGLGTAPSWVAFPSGKVSQTDRRPEPAPWPTELSRGSFEINSSLTAGILVNSDWHEFTGVLWISSSIVKKKNKENLSKCFIRHGYLTFLWTIFKNYS